MFANQLDEYIRTLRTTKYTNLEYSYIRNDDNMYIQIKINTRIRPDRVNEYFIY